MRFRLVPATLLAGALSACAPAAQFPAAQYPTSVPSPSLVTGLPAADARLEVVKRMAWGTPEAFRAARGVLEPLWPDLSWNGNGCSAPEGLGLGHRADFAPACEVHDFAYDNLRVLEPSAANRRISDQVFYANMGAICARKASVARPGCLSAAAAYYAAVRLRGQTRFAPGT